MKALSSLVYLLLIGLSLGWITGMSTSPVIKDVLLSLMTLMTGIHVSMIGIKSNEENRYNIKSLLPLTVFIIFFCIGSSAGVFSRANSLLGVSTTFFSYKWKDSGFDDSELKKMAFYIQYGSDLRKPNKTALSALFSTKSVALCESIKALPTADLMTKKIIQKLDIDDDQKDKIIKCNGEKQCLLKNLEEFC